MTPESNHNTQLPEAFTESPAPQGALTLDPTDNPSGTSQGEPSQAEGSDPFSMDAPARYFGALAKTKAVSNLAEDLIQEWSFSPGATKALAAAPVDPSRLRKQLPMMQEMRVPGGTFKVLTTHVWAHQVIPAPINPRCVENFGYPFLGQALELRHTPLSEPVTGGSGNELRLEVQSRAHLEAVASACSDKVQSENPGVIESVPRQGVMMPVFGVVTEIYHRDTENSTWVIMTPDGSSRVTACHLKLGIATGDVVYAFPAKPSLGRSLVDSALRVAETSLRNLTEDDLARNRVATLPMNLLLGFTPDPGSSQDFAGAVRSLVGLLHVDPPKAWPAAGEREAMLSSVGQYLDKHLPLLEMSYLNGTLSTDEAKEAGFSPYLDTRAAHAIRVVTRSKNTHRGLHDSIGFGIRSVLAGRETSGGRRTQATLETRFQVGWEFALRPVRGVGIIPTKPNTARAALDRILPSDLFGWEKPWEASLIDPDDLRDKALAELEELGEPGPFCRELAIKGTWWLAISGVITRAKSQTQAETRAWREPAQLVTALARNTYGLRIFYAAIIAGRIAQDTCALRELAIPRIDDTGAPEVSGTGLVGKMDPLWINEKVVAMQGESVPGVDAFGAPRCDPKSNWNRRWSKFVGEVQGVYDALFDELLAAKFDNGRTIVSVHGIPHDQADEMLATLDKMSRKITHYAELSREIEAALATDPELDEPDGIDGGE